MVAGHEGAIVIFLLKKRNELCAHGQATYPRDAHN